MQEQSPECFEHHMLLKEKLENFKKEFDELVKNCSDTHEFFFGGINQADGHLSFVDKVNTIYENQKAMIESQKKNRDFLITLFCTFGVLFITSLVGVGIQIHTISQTSNDLLAVIQTQKEMQQEQTNIKLEIAKLKVGNKYETNNLALDGGNKSAEQY